MTTASLANYVDVERQLAAAGLLLAGPLEIGTARPVRCRVDGQGREKRGWYRLYEMPLDGGGSLIVGSYGVWQGNDNGAIKIALPKVERDRMTAGQAEALKARIKADREAAAAELARDQARAAARAMKGWAQCLREVADAPYLRRKGLPPGKLYGARVTKAGNLVIPIADARGRIHGLQVIWGDPAVKARKGRDKDYWPKGLAKLGHWHMIGAAGRGSVILVCEGFATGASLHEATGLPVAVAFDANNLGPVARALAAAYKGARLLLCADDDWVQKCSACGAYTRVELGPDCEHCGQPHRKGNAGVTESSSAALAVGGAWVKPEFPTQRPADRKGDTDFNDLHVHPEGGLPLVARQIEAVLLQQGWKVALKGAAPAPAAGGGGEARPRALAVMPLDDLVARFVPLDDGTGESLFDTWARRIVRAKQAVALLPAGVRWDDVKRHPVWIERGAYYLDQVGFDPGGEDPNVLLNVWQGWPMRPKAGRCERLLGLLRYLCGEDNGDEVYWWLLRWLAYPLQHPGAKLPSAVIMHGPQGSGKSTIFKAIARIYGSHATVLNQRGLEDKFNADWVDGKLFLLAEEVVTRQEMWHIKNELKELVTGEVVRVNGKHVGAYPQRNHINLVFLSNEGQPLPLDNDDRRHLVVWTPAEREREYYDRINEEIDEGGIEALYQYLLDLDLEGWKPHRRPPMTQAKRELVEVSKSSELRFLERWLDFDSGLDLSVCPCRSEDLYRAYVRWCHRNGESKPRTSVFFFNSVSRLAGWEKKKARVTDGASSRPLNVVIPPLDLLPEAMRPEAAESAPDWLGRCCQRFSESLTQSSTEAAWGER